MLDDPAVSAPSLREDFKQLITADGRRVHDEELEPFIADVDEAFLRSLYSDMVAIRRIDFEATALQRQGQLALWPPLLGQEASQIGSVRGLRESDFLFPTYRENGVAFCRGASLGGIMSTWRGNANAGWNPYDICIATPQIIIGAQTLHATGYAMGEALDGKDGLALAYLGDGATSQGDVHEAMVFSSSFQSPVIFFCQNNQWAISEPVGLQSHIMLADRAQGYGMPGVRVDGNDVLAVLAVTRQAAERARDGGGPSFIEAVTYRMGPHTTADDPTRYRGVTELEEWRGKDPLERVESYLRSIDALSEEQYQEIQARADQVAAELREATISLPEPELESIFANVYTASHRSLDRQGELYRSYLATFATDSDQVQSSVNAQGGK